MSWTHLEDNPNDKYRVDDMVDDLQLWPTPQLEQLEDELSVMVSDRERKEKHSK